MAVNQENIIQMQIIKFDLFKSQDPATGRYDTVFDVGGKIIYAHKNMLNMVSSTFDTMLSDRWITKKDEPIKIKDYSYDDFYQFLLFLYSGECQLTDESIYSMVDIGEFYGVQIFKNYCEEYLSNMEIKTEYVFQLMELSNKYSMVQLKNSVLAFIIDSFQSFAESDNFLKLRKSIIEEVIVAVKDKFIPEILFQAVYKWSEKQAMNKQAADSNLNLHETIKNEIADFLPKFCFDKMDLHFLHEFVVKITNINGQVLRGSLIPDNTFIEIIKSLSGRNSSLFAMSCYWNVHRLQLSIPSPLKKRDSIEWYLTYLASFGKGYIIVRNRSDIQTNDYLLAEMIPELSQFQATPASKIEMA